MSSYRLFAATASGAKYAAKGWEAQDVSLTHAEEGVQLAVVADGHGGAAYFRSRQGAEFAAKAVLNQAHQFYDPTPDPETEVLCFGETGIQNFKYAVWQEWRRLVKEHWNELLAAHSTLGEGEPRFEAAGEKYQAYFTSEDPEVVEHNLYTAYGTTLSFALAIPTQILLTQIGDGTCVVLYRNGMFCAPVPAEPRNFLNLVVSLCGQDAYKKMRHVVIDRNPGTSHEPVAVFLTSDGVDDCYPVYRNEEHLYKLFAAILENSLQKGFEENEAEIKDDLLPAMSSGKGSRDDSSLAYLLCDDLSVLQEAYQNIDPELKPAPEQSPEVGSPEAENTEPRDKSAPLETSADA